MGILELRQPEVAPKHTTREGWLADAVQALDLAFLEPHGYKLPEKHSVSCGWPKASAKAIGQCWPASLCADESTVHMFISPELAEPVRVLDVLLHELGHAAVGCDKKHGKEFRAAVKLFGLSGKVTATYAAEGSECHAKLTEVAELLGPYPHSSLRAPRRGSQGTGGGGWVRYRSESDPTYTVLVSPKSIERWGLPKDPDGAEMVPANRRM